MTTEQALARDLAVSNIEKATRLIADANKLMMDAELFSLFQDKNELHEAYAALMTARNNLTADQPVTA